MAKNALLWAVIIFRALLKLVSIFVHKIAVSLQR